MPLPSFSLILLLALLCALPCAHTSALLDSLGHSTIVRLLTGISHKRPLFLALSTNNHPRPVRSLQHSRASVAFAAHPSSTAYYVASFALAFWNGSEIIIFEQFSRSGCAAAWLTHTTLHATHELGKQQAGLVGGWVLKRRLRSRARPCHDGM